MGLPAGTLPDSLPKSSPNLYRRDVATALMRAGTTVSVSSTSLVDLMVSPAKSPKKIQSLPP